MRSFLFSVLAIGITRFLPYSGAAGQPGPLPSCFLLNIISQKGERMNRRDGNPSCRSVIF